MICSFGRRGSNHNYAWSYMGVNLIVSCTKRKTREALAPLRLRDLPATDSTEVRAAEWLRRLRTPRTGPVPARHLYAGDHWSVVRTIAGRDDVRIWICSAGYGLITLDSQLAPYDATFTPGQPDSILNNGASRTTLPAWWAALGTWEGPPGSAHRSIAAVAEAYPTDFLLIALSDEYLKAVTDDVRQASVLLPTHLAIISAGADTAPGLEAHLLPCDSRLQPVAGGALASLNVRLALRLFESTRKELSLERCRNLFRRWLNGQPDQERPSRSPMSDDEIRSFIRLASAADPRIRPTPLLQKLRRLGSACEHGRFTRLFHEVLDHASS
jgi:hypothetical protein